MIKTGYESQIQCADCGRPAFIRELTFVHDGKERRVAYQTHAECMSADEHSGRLKHIDEQYQILVEIDKKLQTHFVELDKGEIVEISIGYVLHSACQEYKRVNIGIEFRAFGFSDYTILPERDIESLAGPANDGALTKLAEEIKNIVVPRVDTFEATFKAGRF